MNRISLQTVTYLLLLVPLLDNNLPRPATVRLLPPNNSRPTVTYLLHPFLLLTRFIHPVLLDHLITERLRHNNLLHQDTDLLKHLQFPTKSLRLLFIRHLLDKDHPTMDL